MAFGERDNSRVEVKFVTNVSIGILTSRKKIFL